MKIYNTNRNIINTGKISMHDAVITNFSYDRMKRELSLNLINEWDSYKPYKVEFKNVIGFEMTSCNYWGASSRILGIYCKTSKEKELIPKLFKKKYDNPSWDSVEMLPEEKYIEILIEFISGDTLTIACEYIEYLKDDK